MKGKKTYSEEETNSPELREAAVAYGTPTHRVIALMGIHQKKVGNDNDFIAMIREGVPKEAMDNLMDITGLNAQEMASITHTSDRTLRRYTAKTKLNQEQSERMIELAKLYSRGEDVLGTLDNFKTWMDTPQMAFGNKRPKEYLDTSLGIEWITDELGRIEHGIFA